MAVLPVGVTPFVPPTLAQGDPASAQATVHDTGATPREDGNNVELEIEQGSLLRSGLQFQAVAQAVSF